MFVIIYELAIINIAKFLFKTDKNSKKTPESDNLNNLYYKLRANTITEKALTLLRRLNHGYNVQVKRSQILLAKKYHETKAIIKKYNFLCNEIVLVNEYQNIFLLKERKSFYFTQIVQKLGYFLYPKTDKC